MAFLPAIQKEFKIIPLSSLNGASISIEKSNFEIQSWFDGSFQQNFDSWLEENIGFRNWFVRLFNQIDFSLFNKLHAAKVVIGKNNFLFEKDYIEAYFGYDFIGKEVIRQKTKTAVAVQKFLKQHYNIDVVYIFAPGKASFMPENIPAKYDTAKHNITNYQYFKQCFEEENMKHLDLHKYFETIKDTSTYPIYSQCGIHWSTYAMTIATDKIAEYIDELRGIGIPDLNWTGISTNTEIDGIDYDLGNLLNLMKKINHEELAYPQIMFIHKDKYKPKVLTIGDSYYWNLFYAGYPSNMFDTLKFWYYNSKEYPESYTKEKLVSSLDFRQQILANEIIMILQTDNGLNFFGFGFFEKAYSEFIENEHDKAEELISFYVEKIKNNSEWLANIAQQAKKENIPLEEMIYKNAQWMTNEKLKKGE